MVCDLAYYCVSTGGHTFFSNILNVDIANVFKPQGFLKEYFT